MMMQLAGAVELDLGNGEGLGVRLKAPGA